MMKFTARNPNRPSRFPEIVAPSAGSNRNGEIFGSDRAVRIGSQTYIYITRLGADRSDEVRTGEDDEDEVRTA